MKKSKTYNLVLSALGAVLIAVCSWVTIPVFPVPFTLQTFAVYCVLCLFGARIGIQSIIVYIALGAVGVPVFSGFTAGIDRLLGMTGGYIVGFLFIGVIFAVSERLFGDKTLPSVLALVIGSVVCYAFGTAWFMGVYARTSGPIGLMAALSMCVFPFLLPDAVKLAAAVLIAKKLRPLLRKHG